MRKEKTVKGTKLIFIAMLCAAISTKINLFKRKHYSDIEEIILFFYLIPVCFLCENLIGNKSFTFYEKYGLFYACIFITFIVFLFTRKVGIADGSPIENEKVYNAFNILYQSIIAIIIAFITKNIFVMIFGEEGMSNMFYYPVMTVSVFFIKKIGSWLSKWIKNSNENYLKEIRQLAK